jgi:fatty acid amide hydrolase 2
MSIHFVIDKMVAFVLEQYWGERKRCPRLAKDEFITKSAVELAAMIRRREVTAHQVVQAYIERIAETNSLVNAVLDGPFVEAMDEAKAIDERINSNSVTDEEFEQKPFLGVPFTTKDSTACKNKLHTLGIVARRTIKAKEDAECVRLMKEAGAILICTSNIPEINRWQETRNKIVGQTNNPYDLRRTVGGSSGGEAALLASCSTAFGLGTDIGGSIRMPAFYCGVFGHKPTVDVISTKGCTLRTGKEASTMVVAGPMTRYASDLMPIFKVLAGPEKTETLALNEEVDLTSLKFYFMTENGDLRCSSLSGDMNAALMKAVDHFSNLSDESVQKVQLAGTEKSTKMWRYWMTQEPASFNTLLGNGRKLNPFVEIFKMLTMRSEYTLAR